MQQKIKREAEEVVHLPSKLQLKPQKKDITRKSSIEKANQQNQQSQQITELGNLARICNNTSIHQNYFKVMQGFVEVFESLSMIQISFSGKTCFISKF